MLKVKPLAGGVVITFDPIFAIFEGHLFVYSFPRDMLDAMLEALDLQDRKADVVRATGEEDLEGAVRQGLVPFVVSPELSEEFRRIPALAARMAGTSA